MAWFDCKEDDLILWKGHLTKFGLNSLNDFQIQVIQSVQLGRDVIVVQPTGSGKSLCFQLPSLFEREKFVVVITPISQFLAQDNDFPAF